ncbi:AmmeMemoRadiSam system protein A [Candidatus Woesearchaeota archaeon]|nr:MAG: AmmeMemoRadiSam system protein A [Candidatus Woesearchaeota archaeon]
MTPEEQQHLLEFARKAIESKFQKKDLSFADVQQFNEPLGCFVTLKQGDKLLGSMGFPEADQPLYEAIYHAAIQAAFDDPRFDGVTPEELQNATIEIILLKNPHQITGSSVEDYARQINPKEHAVLVKKQYHSGIRLAHPHSSENPRDFLVSACKRAGIKPEDILAEDCHVFVAKTEIFSDEDVQRTQ